MQDFNSLKVHIMVSRVSPESLEHSSRCEWSGLLQTNPLKLKGNEQHPHHEINMFSY